MRSTKRRNVSFQPGLHQLLGLNTNSIKYPCNYPAVTCVLQSSLAAWNEQRRVILLLLLLLLLLLPLLLMLLLLMHTVAAAQYLLQRNAGELANARIKRGENCAKQTTYRG